MSDRISVGDVLLDAPKTTIVFLVLLPYILVGFIYIGGRAYHRAKLDEEHHQQAAERRAMEKDFTDLELIELLESVEAGLTGWEMDRLEEWGPMVRRGHELTDKQRDSLIRAVERLDL